jgi:large subunit ribosomal protein L1
MPSPKSGTVTEDVLRALNEFKAGKIEYRADSAGNINIRVGNVAFDAEQLTENVSAMLRHITDSRPASVKGDFVTNITLSSTMGPGVRIAV